MKKNVVHPQKTPTLLYADSKGVIRDFPELYMAGRSGEHYIRPVAEDLVELPEGSELFVLPDRLPIGVAPLTETPLLLDHNPENPRQGISAVAAFMAPAHTAIYTAAYQKNNDQVPHLPLFAYTAVGWYKEKFWVTAFRSDDDIRQDANQFNQETIKKKTHQKLKKHTNNRLIQHLGNCCLQYGCPAARNYFLGRWEAPLPTSKTCNASCVGCISLQPSGCCPATQDRIKFTPTASEISEIAVPHLEKARLPVVSFGQGCEGEPLLQAKTICKAITDIRSQTSKGTINLNTNASLPEEVAKLSRVGLDSIRVSLNSVRPDYHTRYYRPKGFSLTDVFSSIDIMKDAERFVSLNYFILPGFTDDPAEFAALSDVIEDHKPDFIQLRNLNMDPDWYLDVVQHKSQQKPIGIRTWHTELTTRFPWLRFGYFNPPLR